MRSLFRITAIVFALSIFGCTPEQQLTPIFTTFDTGSTVSLRGLYAISETVVWASGSGGAFLRTTDGGETWNSGVINSEDSLDFRSLHAFDADNAIVLSAGSPARIYKTIDGGKTWSLKYENSDPAIFFDSINFSDSKHGLAMGDPMDGKFMLIQTEDAGETWTLLENRPDALEGEGGFAASGTCIASFENEHIWFVSGGLSSRVFRTIDTGKSWNISSPPIDHGQPAKGIFSVKFYNEMNGIIVGGDYSIDSSRVGNAAITLDGGETWTELGDNGPHGFRSCVSYVAGSQGKKLVAVGTSGVDYSIDGGMTWTNADTTGWHVVSYSPDGSGWLSGSSGRVGKVIW